MSLPKGITFKTVKPRGFKQEFRDYIVTPVQTYTNQFSVNDIVRIQFNLQDWYIDPYESYIEAEVRLANESKNGQLTTFNITSAATNTRFYMMDGPSTSLINDFRLECNSREIERIREYDQVGNLLTDLNIYPDVVDQKDFEGYYTVNNPRTIQQGQNTMNSTRMYTTGGTATDYIIQQNCLNIPVLPQRTFAISSGEPIYNNNITVPPASITTNQLTWSNNIPASVADVSAPLSYSGFRIGYSNTADTFFSTGRTIANNEYTGTFFDYQSFLGGYTSANSNYGISHADYRHNIGMDLNSGYIPVVDSPKLAQISGHNTILTNLPTSKILNGKFHKTPMYNDANTNQSSRAYMQIPLLSGVMGVLIPQERWQLIPSSSLGQVNMEFRFNDHAFFSHDGLKPDWVVTRFNLRLRMYKFDPQIMNDLKAQTRTGIQLHSQTFSMGPIYNVQPNVSVTNNWQLNNGIPSIKQLFFWFLSDDYQSYNYARKNYKVSQNITSMQLKISSNYIPQNPILGHAGNIIMNPTIQQDNSVFLSELQQAMNVLFDTKRHININKVNFAINERPYDVTLNEMLGASASGRATNKLTDTHKQILLNQGYTMWNEMRCRGKAVYAFNLEMDKKNDDTMTGIDTTQVRPIELILKSDDPNTYPRNSTMYVMFLSDFIVTFNENETSTEGQG